MNIAEIRKKASALGITQASRKKKDELLSLIAEREQAGQAVVDFVKQHNLDEIPNYQRRAGSMTRGERDALRATPVVLFDPAADVTMAELRNRTGFSRYERRHRIQRSRSLTGVVTERVYNIPRSQRRAGVMTSATRLDLAAARAGAGAYAPLFRAVNAKAEIGTAIHSATEAIDSAFRGKPVAR